MTNYIKNIVVKNIFHLQDFNIAIADEKHTHLFITGKNGSGKTILLNAIGDYLDMIRADRKLSFLNCESVAQNNDKTGFDKQIEIIKKIGLEFEDIHNISNAYHNGEFVFAFYTAGRKSNILEPKSPEKPILDNRNNIKEGLSSQFIKFLVDLKFQEALAKNENHFEDANEIAEWFNNFEKLLCEIYDDENLKIIFNYKDYSFRISTEGKLFKFTELSDGFSAIIDIIADLILKMQNSNSLTRAYKKRGIVLIDEIETHLHLALQKNIMPILTKVFPNIQFIVTTHSPFVLNSIPNSMSFDLEHKKTIENLSEYSYESLAEGYFGVNTESSYMEMRLKELQTLLEKENWTISEKSNIKQLVADFNKISEIAAPDIKNEFNKTMIVHINKVREINND